MRTRISQPNQRIELAVATGTRPVDTGKGSHADFNLSDPTVSISVRQDLGLAFSERVSHVRQF
jgi:hypothetical protein